jgi:hypothetical protein
MKKVFSLILLLIALSSHELFLKTDSYFLEPFQTAELYLFNGTFDESENVITRDRIINNKVIGPNYQFAPGDEDYYDKDLKTYLKIRTGQSGTYVAGVSTLPRNIELSSEDFATYLKHEGLTDVLSQRKKAGIDGEAAVEKYSKHVKALLQVGEEPTDDYTTVLGYPIEFIPLANPYKLTVGDQMSFRLLFDGKPLANQTVHMSWREGAGAKARDEMSTRTDEKGEFSFTIEAKGHWYVASIYMQESTEKGLDYESNWATLTFEVDQD